MTNRLIRVTGAMAILMSLFATVAFMVTAGQNAAVLQGLRPLSNLLGLLATGAGLVAFVVWVARRAYSTMAKRQLAVQGASKNLLLTLRAHHTLIGWVAILIATAHGMFFLLRYPNRQFQLYTGLAAWGVLAFAIGLGLWLQYRVAQKRKSKPVRKVHFTLASVFVLISMIHIWMR